MKDIKLFINEGKASGLSKSKLMDLFMDGGEAMGYKEMLDALLQAMSQDELQEYIEFIDRNYELGLFKDEDEEDE